MASHGLIQLSSDEDPLTKAFMVLGFKPLAVTLKRDNDVGFAKTEFYDNLGNGLYLDTDLDEYKKRMTGILEDCMVPDYYSLMKKECTRGNSNFCTEDYIHRVGRTARAGRSGLAISLVNQYECGNLQKIESLIGKKLPEHRATVEEVMQLSESVKESTRLATKKIKESGKKKRKWGGDDDAEEDVLKYSTHMDRKS